MYILIQKKIKYKKTLQRIAISLTILTTIALIYLLHKSSAKLLVAFWKMEKVTKSVLFIPVDPDSIRNDTIPVDDSTDEDVTFLNGRYPVVSNDVHYLRINEPKFSFIDAMCLLSVFRNHVPSQIYIHTSNSSLSGPFWEKILETKGLRLILKVIPLNISSYLSGKDDNVKCALIYNFFKLRILAQYGGIFLSKDVFIVNNLDNYLNHEMTVHWNTEAEMISDQIIIAKKNSRILGKWIRGYHRELLRMRKTSSEPFQYIIYILKRHPPSVFVENIRFEMDIGMMPFIYNDFWYKWQKKDALWLMEDLTTSNIKRKVKLYARQFQTNKNTNTSVKVNFEEKFRKSNQNTDDPIDYVFLQMVKDVYY